MEPKVWDATSETNPHLFADLVVCDCCRTKMLVDMGEKECPFCQRNKILGAKGNLVPVNESKPEVLRSEFYESEKYSKYLAKRLEEISSKRDLKNLDKVIAYCKGSTFSLGQYEEMDKVENILRIAEGIKTGECTVADFEDWSVCPQRIFESSPEFCYRDAWYSEFPDVPFNENNSLICLECWLKALE